MAETRTISARKGTDSDAASKPQRQRITKRKALENHARSYFDAVGRRDVEGMLEHWKEDGVVDLVPLGILRGREEIAAFFTEMFAAFPDAEMTVTRLAAGPERGRRRVAHERPLHRHALPGRRGDRPPGRAARGRHHRDRRRQERHQHRLLRRHGLCARSRPAAAAGLGRRAGDEERGQRGHPPAARRRRRPRRDRRAARRLLHAQAPPHDRLHHPRGRSGLVDRRLGVRHQGLRRLPADRGDGGRRGGVRDRQALPRSDARPRAASIEGEGAHT